jgi:hypothetical protein
VFSDNIRISLESLRCDFIYPGKNHTRYKRNGQHDDDESSGCITITKQREDGLGYLDDQPSYDYVGSPYTKDVTAFEFFE